MKKIILVSIFLGLYCLSFLHSQGFVLHNASNGPTALQTVTVDEEDRIWVAQTTAFSGNIDFFENGEWHLLNLESRDLISARATDIIAKDGIVEVASYGSWSKIDWNSQSFETWDAGGAAVFSLAKDYDNDILYVGNSISMEAFDGEGFEKIPGITNPTSSLYDAKTQTLWAASDKFGLYKFKDSVLTTYTTSNASGIPGNKILDMDIDEFGVIWMVIDSKGLVSFDGDEFITYDTENSNIENYDADNIVVDNLNNIWIGGVYYGGLSYFNGTDFVHYLKSENTIPVSNIRDMDVDSNNQLWMATSSGLMQFSILSSTEEEEKISSLLVYPSHTNDFLYLDNFRKNSGYEIYNLLGEKMKAMSEIHSNRIDVSSLSIGCYIISLKDLEGRVSPRLFFKI